MIYCPGNMRNFYENALVVWAKEENVGITTYTKHSFPDRPSVGDNLNTCRMIFDTWEEGEWLAKAEAKYRKNNE